MESLNYHNNENIQGWIFEKRKSIKDGVVYCKKFYGLDCDILLKTTDLNHNEWLRARRSGISGTDVGAIAGISRYKSPMKIYLEKTIDETEEVENEKMYFGKVMESVVAKEFALRNPGFKISKVNAVLKHKDYEFAIGNIDRLIRNENGERGILEVKTVSEYMKGYWSDNEVPLEYMVQLQWYMFITGTNFGYFAALIGGNKFIQKYIERDDELIEMLKNIAKDFWENNILKNRLPDVDGSEATTEMMKTMYPESNELEIELESNALELINKREVLKENIKLLEIDVAECENKLKDLLKDNEIGVVEDKKVIWKNYKRTSLNSKALKEEEPEIYKKYLHETKYRKFEIK
ncbi:YqaJ viral recombinase family nuclease [Clostridium tertium]